MLYLKKGANSMTGLIEVFHLVISKLNEGNIPYMVVGSFASMVFSEPRLTHDVDIVIELLPADAKKIDTLFSTLEIWLTKLGLFQEWRRAQGLS